MHYNILNIRWTIYFRGDNNHCTELTGFSTTVGWWLVMVCM